MKKAKKLLALLTAGVFVFTALMTNASFVKAADQTSTSSNQLTPSVKFAEAMNPGWNLGNSFDAYNGNVDMQELS